MKTHDRIEKEEGSEDWNSDRGRGEVRIFGIGIFLAQVVHGGGAN